MVAEVLHFSSGFVGVGTDTRTVSGVSVTTWVTENGIDNIPDDLSVRTISARVVGADGTFTDYPGTGRADGTFSIPNVPNGTFYLQNGSTYLVTSESVLDLGRSSAGRPNTAYATVTTPLSISATNLAPWQTGDRLELISTNANAWYFDLQDYIAHPADGETTLSTTADTLLWEQPLIDGAAGDRATLLHLSKKSSDTGVAYTAVSGVATFAPFTQVDGQSASIAADLTPVGSTNTISLDWRLTQYEALQSQMVAGTSSVWYRALGVQGHPGDTSRGMFSNTADFLLVDPPAGADLATGTMSYGQPLVGSWGSSVLGRVMFTRTYQLGTSTAMRQYATVETIDPVGAATAGPLAPRMGPVQNVRIDGADAFTSLTGVATSPTVSWDAPAIGSATVYKVFVRRVFEDAGKTVSQPVATIATAGTSVKVPPGVMTAGEHYLVRILASSNVATTARAPNRMTLPDASAAVLTELFTTAP